MKELEILWLLNTGWKPVICSLSPEGRPTYTEPCELTDQLAFARWKACSQGKLSWPWGHPPQGKDNKTQGLLSPSVSSAPLLVLCLTFLLQTPSWPSGSRLSLILPIHPLSISGEFFETQVRSHSLNHSKTQYPFDWKHPPSPWHPS